MEEDSLEGMSEENWPPPFAAIEDPARHVKLVKTMCLRNERGGKTDELDGMQV